MKSLCTLGRSIVAAFVFAPISTLIAIPVWINEIHYDNASTDAGEFVEIAGLAGTDLSTYSIILYNGNGGAEYDTEALVGVIDDESNGYGALAFPISGIQNGDPDGLALADATGVLQFLSYEGVFAATDEAATGMTSTDIGVAEGSSTPVGHSLQLTGTGSDYTDFTWAAPSPSSAGDLNSGQSISRASVPDAGASSGLLLLLGFTGLVFTRRKLSR